MILLRYIEVFLLNCRNDFVARYRSSSVVLFRHDPVAIYRSFFFVVNCRNDSFDRCRCDTVVSYEVRYMKHGVRSSVCSVKQSNLSLG
jgi:hypothetical protein